MKTTGLALILTSAVAGSAQTIQPPTSVLPGDALTPSAYITGDVGPNHRQWLAVTTSKGAGVESVIVTNLAYTEIGNGLNYLDPATATWKPSVEILYPYPGGCIGTNGPIKAIFANNANVPDAVDVEIGQCRWQSHVIGLSYQDLATGSNVLISEVVDCNGVLDQPNRVTYQQAFSDFKASLVYEYHRGGVEQWVVIEERPPLPEAFGLSSASSVLQVLSEFVAAPQPVLTPASAPSSTGGSLADQFVDFGGVTIGPGKAFAIGSDPITGVVVGKEYATISGRTVLCESVPVPAIATALDELPLPTQAAVKPKSGSVLHVVSSKRLLPVAKAQTTPRPLASKEGILPGQPLTQQPSMRVAFGSFPKRGFSIDYALVTSQSNFTFRNDQTWLVSSPVTFSGTTVFEGGAVIKFTNVNTSLITLNGPFICAGTAYQPTILTSVNDNSVGSTIVGSNGSPTNDSTVGTYLSIPAAQTNDYRCLRMSYANIGISAGGTNSINVWHSQFLHCNTAVQNNGGIALRNVLLAQDLFCLYTPTLATLENVTAADCTNLFAHYSSSAYVTNSIFTDSDETGIVSFSFSASNSVGSGIYQSAGAGNYYFADGSTNRNAGTTNINPALLTDLATKTTYPPLLLTNTTYSTSTSLNPQAQRDTDTPDIGYHYDSLDYIVGTLYVTNSSVLTIGAGTAIAACNSSGIVLSDPSSIVSVGTPTAPNWMVWYQNVQEQPIQLNGYTSGTIISPYHPGNAAPTGTFQFTKFAATGGADNLLYHGADPFNYTNLLVQECEFWNGGNSFGGGTNGWQATLNNNLFYRTTMNFSTLGTATNSLTLSNNLFYGVSASRIMYVQPSGMVWRAYNNSFDTCWFFAGATSSNGYNAYINCTNRINPATGTDVTSSNAFVYQAGPLGAFYQPTNSILIGKGSTTANLTGLYHYTVTTNEVVEGTNTVSIGYHYVAVDSNGKPLDTNGDGIPDYLSDANGNGLIDSGEIGWNINGDLGLKVIITRPKNNSILP